MAQHVICRIDELPKGRVRRLSLEGRDIALFNLGDRFAAVTSRCPHEGADLCHGRVAAFPDADGPGNYRISEDRMMLRCPWHGWEFDLKTGQSYCDPKRMRVKSFDVAVADGSELAKVPYKVEVFDVTVADKYVVLTI